VIRDTPKEIKDKPYYAVGESDAIMGTTSTDKVMQEVGYKEGFSDGTNRMLNDVNNIKSVRPNPRARAYELPVDKDNTVISLSRS
jgi:hypothetical protein